jgi:hypothetical protein
MKRRKALSSPTVPLLLLVLIFGGWWWFWQRPQGELAARLRRERASALDRITQLQGELARASSADLTVPIGTLKDVETRWPAVAEILERNGFAIERVELSPPAVMPPGSTPGIPQGQTGPAAGPPGPGGPQGVPAGAAPGPGQAVPGGPQGVSPGTAPAQPGAPTPGIPAQVGRMRVSLRFRGNYLKLADAINETRENIPGLEWTRLELEGQGDGDVAVNGEVIILGLASQTP